jgi:1,4-dihydroxy-2-naphthoate octaprenyltransferase
LPKITVWIRAARLRTLPLSVAGILAGTGLAAAAGYRDTILFLLTLATTLAYQITSNFANDYGDGIKGTDNEKRIGPERVLQSGALAPSSLKNGVRAAALFSALLTLATLYRAFGADQLKYILLFGLLGALAIWASIRYTVGTNAYGYRGLGDLFVFLFFGLVSVQGCQFLYTEALLPEAWFPAIAIGALSTAVLNLNNLRDFNSDREVGKRTLVVKMGFRSGRIYHFVVCALAFGAQLTYVLLQESFWPWGWTLAPFVLLGLHLAKLLRTNRPENLDPELKKVALTTFFIGLLLFIVNHNFL